MGGGFIINSLGEIRCVARSPLYMMAKSIKSTPSQSSIISTKAASVKKTVQKTAKAIVRPFKKLKHSLSTLSRSPSVVAVSDTEVDDSKQSDVDSGSFHGSSEEPGPEPTPEQELSMLSSHLFCQILTFHFRISSKDLAVANLLVFQT